MPPYDEYSDSDESDAEELQTSVLLGLPDGPIHSSADLARPRVSRIGGLPVHKPFVQESLCHLSNHRLLATCQGLPKWDSKAFIECFNM